MYETVNQENSSNKKKMDECDWTKFKFISNDRFQIDFGRFQINMYTNGAKTN